MNNPQIPKKTLGRPKSNREKMSLVPVRLPSKLIMQLKSLALRPKYKTLQTMLNRELLGLIYMAESNGLAARESFWKECKAVGAAIHATGNEATQDVWQQLNLQLTAETRQKLEKFKADHPLHSISECGHSLLALFIEETE